jgi:hypothetical protein
MSRKLSRKKTLCFGSEASKHAINWMHWAPSIGGAEGGITTCDLSIHVGVVFTRGKK